VPEALKSRRVNMHESAWGLGVKIK
jgi:hypothetical protein